MLVGDNVCKVVIVGGNCIFFVCFNIVYFEVDNQEMLIVVFNGLVDCFKFYGECMGEVVVGVVMKYVKDFNLVCECVLGFKLVLEIFVYDLQQVCGIGLEVVILVVNKIVLGQVDCVVVGGVDIILDVFLGVNEQVCKIFMEINCVKSNGDKFKQVVKLFNFKLMILDIFKNGELCIGLFMGEYQVIIVVEWGIFCEVQDELVWCLYQNLVKFYEEGWQGDLMMLFYGLECDNNMCGDFIIEKLSILKLVFGGFEGIMIVVNFMLFIDGVFIVLMVFEDWVKECGLLVQVYLIYCEVVVVDFIGKKEGLLMVLVYVVLCMFDCVGFILQDFDFYEIYEVFVFQVFIILKVWNDEIFCKECLGCDKLFGEIDMVKFNVKGLFLVVGYLFVVIGVCILVNVVKLFNEKGFGCCLIFICVVGGQGVVVIVEK